MILFMDISRSEGGEVLSVVGGCRECGSRVVSLFINDTSRWLRQHHKTTHKELSSAIEQIGDSLEVSLADRALDILRNSEGSITTGDVAQELGIPTASAAQVLLRLFQDGTVERSRFSSKRNAPYHYILKKSA